MKQISSFMSLVLSYPGQGGHCRTKLLTGNVSKGYGNYSLNDLFIFYPFEICLSRGFCRAVKN